MSEKQQGRGLIAAAVYLCGVFSLPCLPSGLHSNDCQTEQHTTDNGSNYSATVVAPSVHSDRARKEESPQDKQENDCSRLACTVWHNIGVFLAKIWADPVALFTGLLVVVSSFQGYLILRAEAGTREALKIAAVQADAAKLSARNLLRATRPYIKLESITLETFSGLVPNVEVPAGQELRSIHGTFKNQGTAVGFIAEYAFQANTGGALGKPLEVREPQSGGAYAIKQDETHTPELPLDWAPYEVTPKNFLRWMKVWGWVKYTDIHGIRRRSGFAFSHFRMDGVESFFFATGGSSYWYDIEEE
jgi:hypothetical protein